MRIVSLKTPKPKSFNYQPRYYDAQKEELEKKRAILGVKRKLSHNDEFRLTLQKRWKRNDFDDEKPLMTRIVTYLIYATFVGGTIYFILFTDIIEKMLSAFGVM